MSSIPEVDLNLKHYIGHHSEVMRDIKLKVRNYLRNPNISSSSRAIYSAIYNALTYYQNITDLSISGETAGKTFLENTIAEFNSDFKYLSDKYNSKDPTAPRVISAKGRVKSPISAVEKILEKISEYIHDGLDLKKLNDSLRDFIGLRIIIDAPEEIKAQGKQAESDFCYRVFSDLLTYRGLTRQINEDPSADKDYRFIKVNTLHHPNKLNQIKERPKLEGFALNPEESGIYIPQQRPECVEPFDEYFKDYHMYPKSKLYQRLHICASPYYSSYVPTETLPTFIVPSTSTNTCIEYQVCTYDEEEFAEHGKASHTEYKGERVFHRLGLPLFLTFDENTQKIRSTRLDEAMEIFYGYSFKDKFNMDYQTFLRTFDIKQRDNILAGNLNIELDAQTGEYLLVPAEIPVFIDANQSISKIQSMLQNASPEQLHRFYEKNGILDGTISTNNSTSASPKSIKLYTVEQQEEKSKKIENTPSANLEDVSSVTDVDFRELP